MSSPARQTVARDSRKEAVLDAAARLFAEHGYHGTSIRDIASAVEVTPGAIYAHFASKQALLLAVYERGVARVSAAVEAELESGGRPWERLEAACAAHLVALTGHSPFAKVVIRVLPADAPEIRGELTRLRDGHEATFRDLVDALSLKPGVDAGLLRLTLLGALNWAQTWMRPGRQEPVQFARQLVATLRSGAEPKPN